MDQHPLSVLESVLPYQLSSSFRSLHRKRVLQRAMKAFLKDPASCTRPGTALVSDLIYGWGNEGWSALNDYVSCCIEHALSTDGPVLECGSGLTTLLLGAVAAKRGHRHWALEHSPEWALRVRSALDSYRVRSVVLCVRPLKDYGEFAWYDPPLESMPDRFDVVVCDGPPGSTKGGRYGLVSVMRGRLAPGCTLLLDDAERADEQRIAQRWMTETGGVLERLSDSKPFMRITLPGG